MPPATLGGDTQLGDDALQQRLMEDSLARDRVLAELERQPLRIVQTSGSSAGAGSGDFHHYRQYRRAEFARLGAIERDHRKEQDKVEFERRRLAYEEECARITQKKSCKRKRKKAAAMARKTAKAQSDDDDFGPQPGPVRPETAQSPGDDPEPSERTRVASGPPCASGKADPERGREQQDGDDDRIGDRQADPGTGAAEAASQQVCEQR